MSASTYSAPIAPSKGWFTQATDWLDDKGKGAWIAAMVLGFIFVWPVGLAILMYMIWSNRMFSKSCSTKTRNRPMRGSTGNAAFDAYKADTLSRLEEEQGNFESFLERLREAKDKSEFDTFMEERAGRARNDGADA